MNKHLHLHLTALGLYTLLALLLTWPLASQITTHIPGEAIWAFDESTFIWNMWWLKFSLLKLQQSPLASGYIFFPLGIDLTTYTFNLFNAAIGLPLQLAFSLPVASNLTLLFAYVSSAYGVFLLLLYLLHQPRLSTDYALPITIMAAFTAGAVFAFSASRMMYTALGHYNFVTIQWFPFYVLFLLKSLRHSTIKNVMLAALFAAFCLYAELTFSVFLLFLTLIIVLLSPAHRIAALSPRQFYPARLIALLLIGLFTFIFTAPFILAVLPHFLDPAFAQSGWGEGLKLSADLVGLVTVTPLHPLSGLDWITELRAVIEGTARFTDANTLFLGYGILAVALIGFITHRQATGVWLWGAIGLALLSLGPLLTINGQNRFNLDGIEATLPLPFALLHYIPIVNANRVPNRFGIPLTLCLAILVGYGSAFILSRFSRLTQSTSRSTSHVLRLSLTTLLLALLLFDQFSAPLPLSDARIPPVYYQIGAEPGDFTLMELPLGWRNSYSTLGSERTQLQYYQSVHQRPILNGNTSRNPAFKFDYFANIPLFKTITAVELNGTFDEATAAKAAQQAAGLMALYNIKYLVVHDPIPFRKPYETNYAATRDLTLRLIPHQPKPVYQSPGVDVFAVQPADIANPLTLDFGDWTADPYRGAGWAGNEAIYAATANWATGPQAEIFFPVRGNGNRTVSLHIAPFSYPGMPPQQVTLVLNGTPLDNSYSLHEGWQRLEGVLPEHLLQQGLNRLVLNFTHTAQPRQVLPANRAIGSTGVETPVDLEVNSGADFAFITVGFGNEAVDASAHRRGVNVAVVQPETGELLASKGFDTADNSAEADALAQFIAQIPSGSIVIVAAQGLDATTHLPQNALTALHSLGLSSQDLRPPFSAIAVKDAPPNTALQANGEGTAYLRLGATPDTRLLSAAVDEVVFGKE